MSSLQNVKADTDWKHCVNCGFHNLVETFTDHETHTTQWDCPECDQPHTELARGEN